MREINVLNVFDGISCGRVALDRTEIKYKNYFASEIDKYALQVSETNYPNTIQLGDVRGVDIRQLEKIDLFMGGSPCQGFSFAGKQLNFDDPRSKLFFEYVRILKELQKINPEVKFLLENVRMKKEFSDVITKELGVEPIMINSALVSAQNRVRLYWTNIKGIKQPEDRKIFLKDVLLPEEGTDRIGAAIRGRRLSEDGTRKDYSDIPIKQYVESREDGKSNCLTGVQKDNVIEYTKIDVPEGFVIRDKSKCVRVSGRESPFDSKQQWDCPYDKIDKNANIDKLIIAEATKRGYIEVYPGESFDWTFPKSETRRGRKMEDKSNCLTATKFDFFRYLGNHIIRRYTPIECERLMGLPDNYTNYVSSSQRFKQCGNGWQVDTITHILKNLHVE